MAAAAASEDTPSEPRSPVGVVARLGLCKTIMTSRWELHEEARTVITRFRQRLFDEDDTITAMDFDAYKGALRMQHTVRTSWNKELVQRIGLSPLNFIDRVIYRLDEAHFVVLLLGGGVRVSTPAQIPYKCQSVLDAWDVLRNLSAWVCPDDWIDADLPDYDECLDVMFADAPGHAPADVLAIRAHRRNRPSFEALGLHCAMQVLASPTPPPMPREHTLSIKELDELTDIISDGPQSASIIEELDDRLDALLSGPSDDALRECATRLLDEDYTGVFTNGVLTNDPFLTDDGPSSTGEKRRRTGDA